MRLLCACVAGLEWMILTLDGDVYAEDFDLTTNQDNQDIVIAGPRGGMPKRVPVEKAYGFSAELSGKQLTKVIKQAEAVAEAERAKKEPAGVALVGHEASRG